MNRQQDFKAVFRDSVPANVHEVLRAFGALTANLGLAAYLVGGMVRDVALGRPTVDLDIAVEGDAEMTARVFARKTGTTLKQPTRFGTCKIESDAWGVIDVARTRKETYARPGALPDVAAASIRDDLVRRDFTINAMAVSLSPEDYGRLLDPYRGLADLASGRLRILHDGSFSDDPTRILRGIRFAVRYGFRFERSTGDLLRACIEAGCMGSVSGSRVYAELELISREGEAAGAIGLLKRLGITAALGAPTGCKYCQAAYVRKVERAYRAVESLAGEASFSALWLCRLAVLFAGMDRDQAAELVRYLNLEKGARQASLWVACELGRSHRALSRLDRTAAFRVVEMLRVVPPEGLVHLYAVSGRKERAMIRAYLSRWRRVSPVLTGRRLLALGVPEGPMVGKILRQMLRIKLEGGLAQEEDELAYVRRRVSRMQSSSKNA